MQLDEAQLEAVRAKLDLNEQLLWAGRPKPHLLSPKSIPTFLFAIPWCCITTIAVVSGVLPAWVGDGSSSVKVFGRETTYAGLSCGERLLITCFMIPFVVIGISFLLSPLWVRLSESATRYIVTTKRVAVLGRLRKKSWRAVELSEADRADHSSGLSDVFFRGASDPSACFVRLTPEEARAAESAINSIAPIK